MFPDRFRTHCCLRRIRAFSLPEMMVSLAMFLLLMVMILGVFKTFSQCWAAIDGKSDMHRTFIRVSYNLERELKRSDMATVLYGTTETKDWICFKSPIDIYGLPVSDSMGQPVWQKYIMYYTIRPEGDTCSAAASGIDDICPHKYLIRKDIRLSAAITGSAKVKPYLTRTLTLAAAASETYVFNVKPIAQKVLDFNCSGDTGKINFRLRAYRTDEGARLYRIGTLSLLESPQSRFVSEFIWAVVPKNKVD